MPVRPTFWNVPEWAQIALYVSAGVATAILIGKLYLRFLMWRKGQSRPGFDHLPQRFERLIRYAFLQTRVQRERYAGSMHNAIFSGFVILFIGTVLATIDFDVTLLLFDFRILQGPFYLAYELVLDVFTLVFALGLAMSTARRMRKPQALTLSGQFGYVLTTLWFLLITGLIIEGLRLAVTRPEWAWWSPVGNVIALGLIASGMGEALMQSLHLMLWLAHSIVVMVFIASLVETPFLHLLSAPLNVFFSSFRERGALEPLDLEDESIEVFGAGQVPDLSWMQLMDADACTECGRCQTVCPAHMAGTALNPKQIVLDIRTALDRHGNQMLIGNGKSEFSLIGEDAISEEALWACTTCYACVYECPVMIEHVDSIVDMRRHMTLMEGNVPPMLGTAMTQAERVGNPWGNAASRLDWAKGLEVPVMADKKKTEVLYWVGCAGSYDPASQNTSRAVVKILQAAEVDFAVLGEEERCNCEWARRAGNEALFQEATYSNIAVFDQYEFDIIITHCAHCFNTFKNEYSQFGGDYQVVHHSIYIAKLVAEGRITPSQASGETVTYHDSCYLGRYNGEFEAPREMLKSVGGINLVEMERSREKGLCCGGGGAQVWFEGEEVKPVQEIRLEEAMELQPDTIATACPFCTIMLGSAASAKGVGEQVKVRDVAEIIAERI